MSQTIDVKRYEELARQKQGEHRKFLAQLKKKAPKNLDKIVQQVHKWSLSRNWLYPVCKLL